MTNPKIFYRPNRPMRTFQGGEEDNSNAYSSESGTHIINRTQTGGEGANDYVENAITLPDSASNTTAGHLLLVALLEHQCHLQQPEPEKARALFQMLCKQLRKMKIIDPLKTVEELTSIRTQCRNSFMKLMQGCETTLDRENRPQTLTDRLQVIVQPRINHHPTLSISQFQYQSSKYCDEYIEMKKLGRGAYGSVHKVRNKVDDREYAVKKVGFEGEEADMWHRILREVKYLANLSHPNIVRYFHAWIEFDSFDNLNLINDVPETISETNEVSTGPRAIQYNSGAQAEALNIDQEYKDVDYDDHSIVFEDSRNSHKTVLEKDSNGFSPSYSEEIHTSNQHKPCVFVYIQMELCHTNLKDWLENRNEKYSKDPSAFCCKINLQMLEQIFKAVHHIHSKELIHRDLKPHNIFIQCNDTGLEIKVGDFGLSRKLGSSSAGDGCATPLTPHPGLREADFDWTQFTSGVGTTIYAAPEQLNGNDYNQKSDMYSLGLIMYEIFNPFGTETERRKCLTKLRENGVPDDFRSAWPEESKYIEKLLKPDRNERPAALEMLETELFKSKDQIITNLESQLRQKDAVIEVKDAVIEKKNSLVSKLQEQLIDKDSEIARLKLHILSLNSS